MSGCNQRVLKVEQFEGYKFIQNFAIFKEEADVFVANRLSDELKEVRDKVYTRDLLVVLIH